MLKGSKMTRAVVALAMVVVAGTIGYGLRLAGEPAGASTPPATHMQATTNAVGAPTPEILLQRLGERIVAKDVDGIIALHEPDAAIVDWDLSVIRGHANIRAFYVEWFKSNPVLTVTPMQTTVAGGQKGLFGRVLNRTASVMGHYSLTQDAPEGGQVTFTGQFCDIVRQQKDGSWLYVMDNPYPPHGDSGPDAAKARVAPAADSAEASGAPAEDSHHH